MKESRQRQMCIRDRFNSIADFSPDLNFTSGVFNETFAGIHSLVVKPGISKYSPNVLDTSFK